MERIAGVVLAAGKGKRMGLPRTNKVSLPLGNKPMVVYAVELLERLHLPLIIVVVGFAKASVVRVLRGHPVTFVHQRRQLGTAHALLCAVRNIPSKEEDLLVIQGDDAVFYREETLRSLVRLHFRTKAPLTFLTVTLANPHGLGRVVRDDKGKLLAIVEERDATEQVRAICEVNPACYVFSVRFLKKYLKQVAKSKFTGEYYLTMLVDIAIREGEKIETFNDPTVVWRGVNTKEELQEAQEMLASQ